MNFSSYDDFSVRIRARKKAKPRTKNRPDHKNAISAFVTEIHRGRFCCRLDDKRSVIAILARELGKYPIAVGDRVKIVGDISGNTGTLARIVHVEDRHYSLIRSMDDTNSGQQLTTAGASQLLIVTSVKDPEPKAGFIYRAIIAALHGNMTPIIAATKTDLGDMGAIDAIVAGTDIPVIASGTRDDLSELLQVLSGKITTLLGHSGVGKSTLINHLIPHADRKVGSISAIGKGRHTSTSSLALELPSGGWIIDTPGLRTLGLAHLNSEEVFLSFPDVKDQLRFCPRGCQHRLSPDDEECALKKLPVEKQYRVDVLRSISAALH